MPKNESEEERAARLEMEALAGEERQRREQVWWHMQKALQSTINR